MADSSALRPSIALPARLASEYAVRLRGAERNAFNTYISLSFLFSGNFHYTPENISRIADFTGKHNETIRTHLRELSRMGIIKWNKAKGIIFYIGVRKLESILVAQGIVGGRSLVGFKITPDTLFDLDLISLCNNVELLIKQQDYAAKEKGNPLERLRPSQTHDAGQGNEVEGDRFFRTMAQATPSQSLSHNEGEPTGKNRHNEKAKVQTIRFNNMCYGGVSLSQMGLSISRHPSTASRRKSAAKQKGLMVSQGVSRIVAPVIGGITKGRTWLAQHHPHIFHKCYPKYINGILCWMERMEDMVGIRRTSLKLTTYQCFTK